MEHLYLQKIGDVYVKSTVDRYLTMNERRQWLHYHQGVLDFERRIGACRDNHLPYDIEQQALEDYGRKRSALGEIVDGPFYGKTKRPEGLLYDALTWYTTLSEQEEVRQHNRKHTDSDESSFTPEHLYTEVDAGSTRYRRALAAIDALENAVEVPHDTILDDVLMRLSDGRYLTVEHEEWLRALLGHIQEFTDKTGYCVLASRAYAARQLLEVQND